MKNVSARFDVVVVGGGLAGVCAAIAAARHGAKTALVQDRPVLGGNSSSEVRVTPHGAGRHHPYAAETGIIAEALAAERLRCHVQPMENAWTNSQWDLALYDLAQRTPNLTLFVNTPLIDVILADGTRGSTLDPDDKRVTTANGYKERPAINPSRRIAAIEARVLNAETLLTLEGASFIDCTGDGLLAHLAGCSWRWGSEGADEFGELHAPSKPNAYTMGSSVQFYCHDVGRPVPFTAPPWAKKYDDASFFWGKGGRLPYNPRGGFWWIEIGIPFDTITDNEKIREELTAHALGVWDWMKNKDAWMKGKCANYVLDWIGQVPGKRESRRILGRTLVNENQLRIDHVFEDEIAYGGWFLDLHTPGGLLADNAEPMAAEGYSAHSIERAKGHVGPYGLPLSALQSRDIDNLGFAGRDLSATKAALGSIRVMNTCALLGQAIGTAAAVALREKTDLALLAGTPVKQVQQLLLRDGVFLPHVENTDTADLARAARVTGTSEATLSRAEPARAPSEKPSASPDKQAFDLAQLIPVRGERLEKISLCLSLDWPGPVDVKVALRHVPSIWHYDKTDGALLAEGGVRAVPGVSQWADWNLNLALPPALRDGGYVRLEIEREPKNQLTWEVAAAALPGCPALFLMPTAKPGSRGERYRRHSEKGTTFSFTVTPAQPVYHPGLAQRTANRPYRDPGSWRSDPAAPLPQSLTLTWPAPQTVRQVELHFPGELITELSTRPPLSVDGDIARDYRLEALVNNAWIPLVAVTGNYQHHRFHLLDAPVSATSLRLTIDATNGSPSASLANIRVYASPGDYPDPWLHA